MPNNTDMTARLAMAQSAALDLLKAAQVLLLDPKLRRLLNEKDPQALRQLRNAVELAGGKADPDPQDDYHRW